MLLFGKFKGWLPNTYSGADVSSHVNLPDKYDNNQETRIKNHIQQERR